MGSNKRVLAIDKVVMYFDDMKKLVELYPILSDIIAKNVNLLLSKRLPIPPDLISYHDLIKTATGEG